MDLSFEWTAPRHTQVVKRKTTKEGGETVVRIHNDQQLQFAVEIVPRLCSFCQQILSRLCKLPSGEAKHMPHPYPHHHLISASVARSVMD